MVLPKGRKRDNFLACSASTAAMVGWDGNLEVGCDGEMKISCKLASLFADAGG